MIAYIKWDIGNWCIWNPPSQHHKSKYVDIFENGYAVLNQFSSAKNAYLHPLMIGFLVFIWSIVVLKALRYEAIVVWQQLMPLQRVLFMITLLVSQTDAHPITEPSEDVILAKLSQSMATNMFSGWEKMKGLFASFKFSVLFESFLQIESVG